MTVLKKLITAFLFPVLLPATAAWSDQKQQDIERFGAISFEQIRDFGRNDPDMSVNRLTQRDLVQALQPQRAAPPASTVRQTGRNRPGSVLRDRGPVLQKHYQFDLAWFDCNDIWYDGERVKIGEKDAVVLTLMMQQSGREQSSAMTVAFKCRDDEVVELQRNGFFAPLDLIAPVRLTGIVAVTHPREFESIAQKLSESAKEAQNRHRTAATVAAIAVTAVAVVVTTFTFGTAGIGVFLVGAVLAAAPTVANISGNVFQAISEWSGCYTFAKNVDRTFLPAELRRMAQQGSHVLLWHGKGTQCRFGHAGGKYEYLLGGRIVPYQVNYDSGV